MLFIIVKIVYIYVCNMYEYECKNHYNHQSKDKTLTLGRMLTLHALSFFSIRSSFFLTISISILSARTEIFAGPNYTEWLQRLSPRCLSRQLRQGTQTIQFSRPGEIS